MTSPQPSLLYHPLTALGLQCAASSVAIGLQDNSPETSKWLSILATPIHVGCAGIIVLKAKDYIRPSWAAWVAGTSLSIVLRCLGECFLKKPESEDRNDSSEKTRNGGPGAQSKRQTKPVVRWFMSSLARVMDFRHLNSPDEAKNAPHFSSKNPGYVPTRGRFLLNTAVEAILSYLVIDLLTGSPLPPTALEDFAPERMHFFTRMNTVTAAELGLRFVLPVTVFAVGAALMKLGHDVFAFATVASGMSEPRDWRPQFGSITEAFTVRRFWGQVWHQNLRITFSAWTDYLAHDMLRLPRSASDQASRLFTRYLKLFFTFGISGLLHLGIEIASGVPATKARPTVFFLFQALGIMIEDSVQALNDGSSSHEESAKKEPPKPWVRLIGYAWVWCFMAWSVPWWIYPPTHYYALQGQAPRSLVPFSIVRWCRT